VFSGGGFEDARVTCDAFSARKRAYFGGVVKRGVREHLLTFSGVVYAAGVHGVQRERDDDVYWYLIQ
jgi:hypothetical protein